MTIDPIKTALTVDLHPKWDASFPEEFPWQLVHQASAEKLADRLCKRIREDLKGRHRLETPGLRAALVELAGIATVG